MTLSLIINDNKKKLLKYKIAIIGAIFITIFLIVGIIRAILKINMNKEEKVQETVAEVVQGTGLEQNQEDDVIVVELEDKKNKEEARAKEIEEEKNAKGVIYLTFDDGPSLDTTPKILDILERKNVKATFFVLNYDEKKEQLIKREAKQDETIALHGYTHTYSDVYQSADMCIQNFKQIQNKVQQTTGIKSNIIRFPGGSSNTISRKYCEGVMTELSTRVLDEGFRYFDWNVDSEDAGSAKSSEDVYNNVTTGIKENRNNVVLMHDFGGNEKTINALEGIIDYGLENGYVFRKITDDVPMCKHSVNN